MNARTQSLRIDGPAGPIECALDAPDLEDGARSRGLAVVCHPHPQHGGTLDNKVVQTLSRAFVQLGYRALRFNFRGVGASAGTWADGPGEVDDAVAVVAALRERDEALVLAGFSFGAYVASQAASRLARADPASAAQRLVLVGAAAGRFDVAEVPKGTLVIHGESDDVVPLLAVFDWARPQSLPVTVIPGAGHFFHGQLTLLKSLVIGAWRA
ncbi:MAG: alpha/beta hydrolase [Rubrivivax sp.]